MSTYARQPLPTPYIRVVYLTPLYTRNPSMDNGAFHQGSTFCVNLAP